MFVFLTVGLLIGDYIKISFEEMNDDFWETTQKKKTQIEFCPATMYWLAALFSVSHCCVYVAALQDERWFHSSSFVTLFIRSKVLNSHSITNNPTGH